MELSFSKKKDIFLFFLCKTNGAQLVCEHEKYNCFAIRRSGCLSPHQRKIVFKQARKLQATLFRNYDLIAHSMTGVKCRATSVAKKIKFLFPYQLWQTFDVGCKSGIMYQKDEISHLWNEALKVAKEWNQPSLKWNIENMNW